MPMRKLERYLDDHGVKYLRIRHSPAFTAQEIAASAHIPGKHLAKTVVVKLDGRLAMIVLPASNRIDFDLLRDEVGAERIELAEEREFRDLFPDCELGAMPPFGNLWNVPVFVDDELTRDDEIAFNAGSHTELLKLPYREFARLVGPAVVRTCERV
ncbi:MAG TPA: YbaK/EbsC family protein [Candidatus Polarisedimenticolaceae bacterium]|nr:YbaK/EbsC family protein [Candidatus Polarisedimenticolaceae bacterium]